MTRIRRRLSFRITSAALVLKSPETPLAIRPKSPIEQGQTIIVSYLAEPEAKGFLGWLDKALERIG